MRKIYMVYKNEEPGDNNDWNPTNKKSQSLGTKIIADARPKTQRKHPIPKKMPRSRKEYIEDMAMKEKWWAHCGRHKWY
ncbi:MAG: hypothetical protein KJ630_21335 [Proteobacteria bacterium]|nr:hypothetical protein [Pseudomonadota bacterium]